MSTQHMNGFIIRPPKMEDVESVVDVMNACSRELIGAAEFRADEMASDWESPNFNLEADARLVAAPDGRPVGYIDIWDPEPHVRMFTWGHVHPDYRGLGIGTRLCQWAEERAYNSIPKAPEGARVVLRQGVLSTNAPAQALLQQRHYRAVRHFFRMMIEMDAPPPQPVLPEGIRIRPYVRSEEVRAVISAVRDCFKDHWGYVESPFEQEYEDWKHWIETDPEHDPSLWFLAMDGEQIAAVSLCRLRMVEDAGLGWVNTLGVRRPWRRQGVALALLHHSFGELYRRGQRKVGLGVDANSLTGATRLYEKAGMHVCRKSISYEKELRPGVDLSTQSVEH